MTHLDFWVTCGITDRKLLHWLVQDQTQALMSDCLHLLLQSLELKEDTELHLEPVPQHPVHYSEIEDDCFVSFSFGYTKYNFYNWWIQNDKQNWLEEGR